LFDKCRRSTGDDDLFGGLGADRLRGGPSDRAVVLTG
jgi:hypothetical protein